MLISTLFYLISISLYVDINIVLYDINLVSSEY